MLDLKVEIASLAREMSTGIQQYQIVELGSPKRPRRLEVVGRINANAVTPEDTSARVAGRLVGIDEENSLVIENRAGTKRRWLVHTKLRKPERVCGKLGRILLPGGGEVNRIMKNPDGQSGLSFFRSFLLALGRLWRRNGSLPSGGKKPSSMGGRLNPAVASIELKLAQG